MHKATGYVSGIALFCAGVATALVTSAGRERNRRQTAPAVTPEPARPKPAPAQDARPEVNSAVAQELKRYISQLESRLAAQEALSAARFGQIEARLEEHAAKLAEAPSTAQIVGAMEQLMMKTMASLDERLSTQAHSIEVLKTTVSQTDNLLERVLESLDSLQTSAESSANDTTLYSRAG